MPHWQLFCKPGDNVYEGQVVGIHQRPGDLKVNVAKKKAVNNIRSATKENTTGLSEPKVRAWGHRRTICCRYHLSCLLCAK